MMRRRRGCCPAGVFAIVRDGDGSNPRLPFLDRGPPFQAGTNRAATC